MPTPHNEAKKEDIAKIVLMPGDPQRAKYIAENYLENYKLVNKIRGMYAYTGNYKGNRITVMAHGMGNPSVGIYTYELFKYYDVDTIIRIGSAGATTENIALRTIILDEKTYSKTSYGKLQNNSNDVILGGSKELNENIKKVAKEMNLPLVPSIVYCTDAFYNSVDDINELFNKYGCTCVEMESYALFHNASLFNKKAACLLTISNNLVTNEELSSYERENSFNDMIKLALETTLL